MSEASLCRCPRPRHRIVRLSCLIAGVGILAAVAIGTLREAGAGYRAIEEARGIEIRVPALPAPDVDVAAAIAGTERLRLLVNVVFADVSLSGHRLRAEEYEIDWPRDQGKKLDRSFRFAGGSYQCEVTFERPIPLPDAPRFAIHVRLDWRFSTLLLNSGGARELSLPVPGRVLASVGAIRLKDGLSALPEKPHELTTVWLAAVVDPADPLARKPLLDELKESGLLPQIALEAHHIEFAHPDWPGASLFVSLFPASVLLLVAAALLSQVFAWRFTAFAGALLFAILLVAALDHTAVAIHAWHLENLKSTPEVKHAAADGLAQSFFYRETAGRALRAAGL